ncbi:MAG: OmpH family outer membrane protein [Pseudomonadota bacterium]
MRSTRLINAALAVLMACGVLVAEASAQRGGQAIILVDRQKIVGESDAFQSVSSQLKAVTNQIRADLQKKETELRQGMETLQKSRESLSREDFQKRATALSTREIDLLAEQEIANRELAIARNNALTQLEEPLEQAVRAIAKKRKDAIVLDKSVVVYPGGAPDVTDDVLKDLNKRISSIQVVKPTTSDEDKKTIRQQIQQQVALQQMEAVGRRQVMAIGQQSLQAAAGKK